MKRKNDITIIVDNAVSYLTRKSYSERTIYRYIWIWKKLIKFAKEKGDLKYSAQLSEDFKKHFIGDYENSVINKFSISKLRALKVLDDIFYERQIKIKYLITTVKIPPRFQTEYDSYKDYITEIGQKPKTIETKLSRVLVFLRYLDETNQMLKQLDFNIFTKFQEYMAARYTKNAQANIKFTLRDFLKHAEDEKFVPSSASSLLGTIYSDKHGRLPSTYTIDEINQILHCVDRASALGKRDYAMIVFLTFLGMRSSDVCNLRLESINLNTHCLVFQQQKTGSHENLPLTEEMEIILADYLKNARPKTESVFIFVKGEGANKGEPLCPSALYYILNKYMDKANIMTEGKRHGPHSMRHSLSSNLLKNGTPISVLSGILGHGSSEVTARYLWMDTEQLRKLALEVPYEK